MTKFYELTRYQKWINPYKSSKPIKRDMFIIDEDIFLTQFYKPFSMKWQEN